MFVDSSMSETTLQMAQRHVREAQQQVARQRRLVAKLRRHNHDAAAAIAQIVLGTLEEALAGFRRHLRLEQDHPGALTPPADH